MSVLIPMILIIVVGVSSVYSLTVLRLWINYWYTYTVDIVVELSGGLQSIDENHNCFPDTSLWNVPLYLCFYYVFIIWHETTMQEFPNQNTLHLLITPNLIQSTKIYRNVTLSKKVLLGFLRRNCTVYVYATQNKFITFWLNKLERVLLKF